MLFYSYSVFGIMLVLNYPLNAILLGSFALPKSKFKMCMMSKSWKVVYCFLLVTGALLFVDTSAQGLEIKLKRPGDREFVRDLAKMIDTEDEKQIKELCEKLLNEKATPIIVVTIESMAKYGAPNMTIGTFATLLFNQWQIGHAKLVDQDWDTGILLVISKKDRKARIELGRGWGRSEDALCKQIMDEFIIYNFKQEKFSAGIVAGVEGLDKMARKLKLPTRPRPWTHYALMIGFVGLAAFTIFSLIRRGSSGWAWLFWAAAFSIAGYVLYQALTSSNSGGGSFSGGSFGGGSSGGGGASGSW